LVGWLKMAVGIPVVAFISDIAIGTQFVNTAWLYGRLMFGGL